MTYEYYKIRAYIYPKSNIYGKAPPQFILFLKGLSHEIDFDNIDKNWGMLALISAAAGFWLFWRRLWFLVEIKHPLSGTC